MKEKLKELAQREGISCFGVFETTKIKSHILENESTTIAKLPYGISIGYRLSESILQTIQYSPTLLYKHHYKTVNWMLDQISTKIVNFIQSKNKLGLAIPASQIVDWEKQVGDLSHIVAAREAGLGWIGRSGLLVNPLYGAKVRYATILTNIDMDTDNPIVGDCGNCENCTSACPANAINKSHYDKNKCLEQLKEFSKIKGIGVYICGICVSVCNGNIKK